MATAPTRRKNELRVSSYDRVSSWLLAFLGITGVTVSGLMAIFFSQQWADRKLIVPVMPISLGGGGGTGGSPDSMGTGDELEQPGDAELAVLMEPQLPDTLAAIESAVTLKSAIVSDDTIDVGIEPTEGASQGDSRRPGFGGGSGGGSGGGVGSGFGRGRGGPPEPQREIRFEPSDLAEYARWLDFFKIELGVLNAEENRIYYAYNLSQSKPSVRTGAPSDEQRLYMNPTNSQFAALDRELAEAAGIAEKGQIILQFFPPPAQAILYNLEQKHDGTRRPDEIRRTVFRVRPTAEGFEFSVEEQFYR
jgi:hypothetical protein